MINYIKELIRVFFIKKTFQEYGFEIKKFQVDDIGEVEYAQWLHPFELPKKISKTDISFYEKICQKGEMIIDVGAHTGDTTVPMAIAVGKTGIVLGIEPNKYVFKILEENANMNKQLTNIVPLCFAATSREGEFTFNYSDASFCNGGFFSELSNKNHHHHHTLEVNGKNLQNFLLNNYAVELDRLSLIKIDAEGYDKEILKTISGILEQYRPTLIVECNINLNNEERNELFDVISIHNYQLFYLENFDSLTELKEVKREDMSVVDHFDIIAFHESKKENVNHFNLL